MKGDILVLGEHRGGASDKITWELLSKGRELADQWGTRLAVLHMGSDIEPLVTSMKGSAADLVLAANHPSLKDYRTEIYTATVVKAIRQFNPSLVLMGYTYLGMEIGTAAAARMNATLVTNCRTLDYVDDGIQVIRSMYAGALETRLSLNGPAPLFISMEKGALPYREGSFGEAVVESVEVEDGPSPLRCRILERLIPTPGDVDITKARILVSVGRGIGGKDKIGIIRELAEALGGAVSCSRPVVDMGWLSMDHQVGISANAVTPDVYIACGISGASQHITAMRDSRFIAAINKDPKASIFRVAHCGIVGDLFDVVPALIQEARSSAPA
jgi:electron transfer flavoprotein alpha subunit